ncbi:cytochrome P450 [Pluteus cervinus]|uniref:Cytochrome P450 n=1 Tax=Pluteus cervinus TaxID=181527 RepID=A0ACD3A1I1_9AGAR|nr:cytochrome P450 [Pluteus cervinus]
MENLNWYTVSVALAVVFILSRVHKFMNGLKAVNHLAGPRVPFELLSLPGVFLPPTRRNPGFFYVWNLRHHFYKIWGSESVAFVPWLTGGPTLVTTNVDVVRQVNLGAHRSSWEKSEDTTRAIKMFGMNIIAADGEQWRKHRRIVGPAFSKDLYQLVWQEVCHIYDEMTEAEGWSQKDTFEVPAIQSFTFKMALLIIGNCGFGFNFEWSEPPAADGTMSIQEALEHVTDLTRLIFLPRWITKLPIPLFKRYQTAYAMLMQFMREQIAERRQLVRGGTPLRKDIFTTMVQANEDEEARFKLDDDELIGNIFVMLLAGHETTAHSVAATLGLLALHEDIQDEVHEEIMSVIGHRDSALSDFTKLEKVVSAFYEAIRMFPPGFVLVRHATEDTVLHLPNPVGQEGTTSLPIQKGTRLIVDVIGIQYNPRYFDEPEKFKPQRWYGVSRDSESASAFAVGSRACLGRKFATIESVCFLASLLRDWKVTPTLRVGETKEAWQDRVMDAKIMLTLSLKDVPLTFTRREARK